MHSDGNDNKKKLGLDFVLNTSMFFFIKLLHNACDADVKNERMGDQKN